MADGELKNQNQFIFQLSSIKRRLVTGVQLILN